MPLLHKPIVLSSLLLIAVLAGCQKENMLANVEAVPYLGLPANINHLHNADLKRLRGTQIFQDALEQLQRDNKGFANTYNGLRQQVGFDPVQQIDMLTVAFRGKPEPNQPLSHIMVLARGQFTDMTDKLEQLRAWLGDEFLIQPPAFQESKHAASEITIHQMSARSQYNERIEIKVLIAFPTDHLMILGFSPQLMNDALDVIGAVKGVQGVNNSPQWAEKLRMAQISATVWGFGEFKLQPESQNALANIPDTQEFTKIQNYFYDFDSDGELRMAVGFVCDSIDSATKLSASLTRVRDMLMQQLKGALPPDAVEIAKLPTRLLITTEMKTSRLVLRLTSGDINKLNQEIEKITQPEATPTPKK